jgi:hypothetical protein
VQRIQRVALRACAEPTDPRTEQDRFLTGLPQHGVYVALPPVTSPHRFGQMPIGFFLHLEHDHRGGPPELRLVEDTDGTWDGLMPHFVHLDRPTLLASAREQGAAVPALKGDDSEMLAAFASLVAFAQWPALLALTDPRVAIGRWDLPGERPAPAGKDVADAPARSTWWRVSASQQRPRLGAV